MKSSSRLEAIMFEPALGLFAMYIQQKYNEIYNVLLLRTLVSCYNTFSLYIKLSPMPSMRDQ